MEGGTKVYINGPGHMTKMAAMPIYGKNLLKSSSPEPPQKSYDLETWYVASYKGYINDDPGMTLTYKCQGQIWMPMLLNKVI